MSIPQQADWFELGFDGSNQDQYKVTHEGRARELITIEEKSGDETMTIYILPEDLPRFIALLRSVHEWHLMKFAVETPSDD